MDGKVFWTVWQFISPHHPNFMIRLVLMLNCPPMAIIRMHELNSAFALKLALLKVTKFTINFLYNLVKIEYDKSLNEAISFEKLL